MDFALTKWDFCRADGSVVGLDLTLSLGGAITPSPHPNESFWRVDGGCLCFLNGAREVTTIFTESRSLGDGRRVLQGSFLASGGAVLHILKERRSQTPPNPKPVPKVAVLIRTHLNNPKLADLANILAQSNCYDLYICADCTNGEVSFEGMPVLRHVAADAERLGLPTAQPNLLWYCGDYPLYFSFEQIPDYDYYIMVEYDVHIVNRTPLVIEGLINRLGFGGDRRVDFVGTRSFQGRLDESWGITVKGRYPEAHLSLFPFVAVSQAALAFLLGERRAERRSPAESGVIMFCEAFVPSALKANGFCVVDVTALLDGAVQNGTFRVPSDQGPMLLGQKLDLDPRTQLIHPVYDEEQFLRFHFHEASAGKDPAKLAAIIDAISDYPLSVRGRERLISYLRRLNEALAAGGDPWVGDDETGAG
jgi:hypothetical protein